MSDAYEADSADQTDIVEDFDEVEEVGAEGAVEDDEGAEDAGDSDEESEASSRADDGQRAEAEGRQGQTSRASRRIEGLLARDRERERELADLRRRLDDRERQAQETPQQRQMRLDAMDPYERQEFLSREREQRLEARIAQAEFRAEDRADKSAFDSLCARNPAAQKMAQQVEDRLAESRRNGVNIPRESILYFLLGQRAMANAPRANGRNQARAEANRQRQTARPTSGGRSDTRGEGRGAVSEREARRQRLEDQLI